MLEGNEIQAIVDSLNVLPDRGVFVPNHFSYPTTLQALMGIRNILTIAIMATDTPHVFQLARYGVNKEYVITRNNDRPTQAEIALLQAERIVSWRKEQKKNQDYIEMHLRINEAIERIMNENNE
jgi:hypothetical protein